MSALGEALRTDTDAIVQRWYEAWKRSRHPHSEISEAALKDRLPLQLRVIGEQLMALRRAESTQEIWKLPERLDPETRVDQDIPIEEVVQEYRIAVDVVRNWIEEHRLDVSFREASYFYAAIFELAAESVRRYARYTADQITTGRAEYLAGLAHQMRTPLNALVLHCDLIGHGDRHVSERALSGMRRNVDRLRLLADGVMRLERFKPGELPVHPRDVVVAELVDRVVAENEFEAQRKGLALEVESALPRGEVIHVDVDLFLDALGNLVQNAVKYTARGFVQIHVEPDADAIRFEVRDSGSGIGPERRHELFKPVVPGKPGGVGIGLTVAHRAVQAQGGEIGAESRPGEGSVFWFRLPRQVEPRGPSAAQ